MNLPNNIETIYQMPSWLQEVFSGEFPNSKNEDFFFFPLKGTPKEFSPQTPINTNIDALLAKTPITEKDIRLVFLNGEICWEKTSARLKDIIVETAEIPASTSEILKTTHWDYFKALSVSCLQKVYHISIAETSPLADQTLHTLFIQTQPQAWSNPQLHIHIEKEKKFCLSTYYLAEELEPTALQIPYTFVHLENHAQFLLNQTFLSAKGQFIFPYTDVYQQADSIFQSYSSYIQGDKTRISLGAILAGKNAKADMKGFYIAQMKEQCEYYTRIYHRSRESYSNQLFKGISRAGGHFSFNGDIVVSENTSGVEAYQLSKNMLLDKNSRVFTRPQLHVDHHDLKCTHGATVGGLNDDELFYLQSRGISLEMATTLTILGFIEEITEMIPQDSLREWTSELVRKKLMGDAYGPNHKGNT